MKQTFGKTEQVGFQVMRIRAESKNIVHDKLYSLFPAKKQKALVLFLLCRVN